MIQAMERPGKPLVLVVEDDATIQAVLRAVLREECEVHCVRHGAEALEGAEKVILLGPREQLPVVQKANEGELETPWREGKARNRKIGRDDQRKQRESQDDQGSRQNHDAAGMPVRPFSKAWA